ncbi:MAG: DUF4381 family protein [Pseudoxanthomonas sp.]
MPVFDVMLGTLQADALQAGALPLRDVHLPPALPWWPPAPGWWILLVVLLLTAVAIAAILARRRRRRRAWQALFDEAVAVPQAEQRIAAMSELLRRAARKADAHAGTLEGEAWLRFLDGDKQRDFSEGTGRLLLDGAYRRDVDDVAVARLLPLARARFLELAATRK